MPVRLVVGLGNPGPEYDGTRHNVGFEVVDRLAAATGRPWIHHRGSSIARGERGGAVFVLAKPLGFMNNSGRPVRELLTELGDDTALLVVCDDFHLPLGKLRCRLQGRDGGQKGLQSILAALPDHRVPRLRIGLGEPPPTVPAEDYVLKRFGRGEAKEAAAAVARAADCILEWLEHGFIDRLVAAANAG